jgi:hypothetical protein
VSRIIEATRLPSADSWQRCQTRRGLVIRPHAVRIVLLVISVASVMVLLACGTETAQGRITGAYQPLRSGMVQMYIEVELDDGTEVDALLPMRPPYVEDQKIWDKVSSSVRSGGHLRVEIQRKGSGEAWEFVRFLSNEDKPN